MLMVFLVFIISTLLYRVFGGSRKVPPASKKFVDELPTKLISPTIAGLFYLSQFVGFIIKF